MPPTRVSLKVAYETPHGNPLKSYSPNDFALHGDGALEVEHAGCRVTPGGKGNELVVDIDDSGRFSLAVHGFDSHRDVYTDVNAIAEETDRDGETA